ncbi:MAG: glycerol-3-phosphate dehydrogenase/oxidase [Planctomycetaceae bacterium]|jgi:glycerol-3-phosphate dehydrogenase|nr:glycerol-3-phosphate dehydrogenase/oxidase [Planctomycetaceae bacterium]
MKREELFNKIRQQTFWDVIVIGGGATGLGIALDASLRGYSVLLLEQHDFTKGTSSKSTKLVHGGVRYLAQGDVGLVIEALRERGLLLQNAPHLVKNQTFIIPNYQWRRGLFYTIGLTMYDILAGRLSFGRSYYIGRKEVIKRIPTVRQHNLKNGVVYHDGQFDDSRLAIHLVRSILKNGGVTVNYVKVTALNKSAGGEIIGVNAQDMETGLTFSLQSKLVINATGVFVNDIIQMDIPNSPDLVRPSQGIHLVVDREFLPGDDALMIPKTDDGRVLFAVPWHDKVVIGTTDTPINETSLEPKALDSEIDFVLQSAGKYLEKPIQREDVRSVFSGLRPLAAPKKSTEKKTREISRNHKIIVSDSGLLTITGGKWTTYRRMAQDVLDKAISIGKLEKRKCVTEKFHIHGFQKDADRTNPLYVYGADRVEIERLAVECPKLGERLHERLSSIKAEIIWAVRFELARSVEDVLARRLRALLLDARAAIDIAPIIADLIAEELNYDENWKRKQIDDFVQIANQYLLVPYKQ